jgi:multiple sugar transport system permease protein
MTANAVRDTARVNGVEVPVAWVARRRWSYAILIYGLLIFFSLIFMGPLLMSALSSLKVDALESPPRLYFEELRPRNWSAAWSLGQQGSGNPWTGGIRPGANIPFYASYLVPATVLPSGETPKPLSVTVPRVRPGAGAAALGTFDYASDYVQVNDLKVARTEAATMRDGKPATRVVYEWRFVYPQDAKNIDDPSKAAPEIKRTPLTLEAERGYIFETATLEPSRLENPQAANAEVPYEYAKIQSYVNVTSGVLNYVFRNYFRAFEDARSQTTGQSLLLRWIINSFLVVFLKTIMTLVIASLAGYAIARLEFPGKGLLFLLVLFIMTVPGQVTFISNYLVLKNLGLLNTVWGLTVSGIVVAGQVFFMKQFFETLPKELEEAAKIDGATPFQTFWRVILPVTGPALGALTITSAQGAWNEYFWALIVLQSPQDNFTLPIGLNTFNRIYGNAGDQGLILAGAIISAIPVIILFAVFQRYFVSNAASSGGKE